MRYPRSTVARIPRRAPGWRRDDEARRVADLLRLEVCSADPRWKLPSEYDLIRSFAVSRNTIRVALDMLRHEGLLERLTGAGTFSTEAAVRHHLDLSLQPSEGLFGNAHLERQVLVAERRPAPPPLARLLGVSSGDESLLLEKLVTLAGEPLYLATDWFPSFVADRVQASDLRRETSEILSSLGFRLGRVDLSLEAVRAGPADSDALGVDEGAPLLLLQMCLRLEDSSIIECSFIRLRGDRLTITPPGEVA
jgi:GntR family transcriptional regulator